MAYAPLASLMLLFIAGSPAAACAIAMPLKPTDVKYADVVVVGRLSNYRIVLDEKARQDRKTFLARLGERGSPTFRETLKTQRTFLSDYAVFDVEVFQNIRGKVKPYITVMWQNSTFGEPAEMAEGPYMMALQTLKNAAAQSSSATIPHPSYILLQSPCAPPFLFEGASTAGAEVRRILSEMSATAPEAK
jgi:hypothetical protein